MAAESSRDDARQSDLAVMDANEYKQKRRLERILDSMDRVEEQANKAWDGFVNGKISHDAKNIMIQRAVKEAIRETYNLLIDHYESVERAETDGGQVDGSPTKEEYWVNGVDQPIGVIKQRQEDDIRIWGLRDFLESKEIYREEWVEEVDPRNQPPRDEQFSEERSVPEQVSWRALLRLKEFLNKEHDLEVKFEELDNSLPTWGFEEIPDEIGTEEMHGDD